MNHETCVLSRTTASPAADRRTSSSWDRAFLRIIQRALGSDPIRVQLWDGSSCYHASAAAAATVTIGDRATLLKLLWDPEFWFGESFAGQSLIVSGDLLAVLEAIYHNCPEPGFVRGWFARARAMLNETSHSLDGSRSNIQHHYDVGNDFYRLWLDRNLVYTCAYFPSQSLTLEEAQVAKMDYVCRKLRLRPGDRVIEAGCGWGALAIHMAAHYGVSVRAFNISHAQVQFARNRAAELGLRRQIEFIEDDYRNVTGRCDAFVSVGMLEHIGLQHYRNFGEVIHRVLERDGGRGLLHFIGRNRSQPLNAWIRERIFPGAYVPTLAEAAKEILEPWNFSILDVENLRLHYARTLRHWRMRFESAVDRVTQMCDDEFARAWRLYLAGSEAAFSTGRMQLFQVTFASGEDNRIPWTRSALYRAHELPCW
jgi:cyclopropane-fatty-acyl-phospholipid synthase